MKHLLTALLAAFLFLGAFGDPGATAVDTPIKSARALVQALQSDPDTWDESKPHIFDITGTLVTYDNSSLVINDETGGALAFSHALTNAPLTVTAGDVVRIKGTVVFGDQFKILTASCLSLAFLRHGQPPPASVVTGTEFTSGDHDYRPVRVQGLVLDIVEDENDRSFTFLVIDSGGERILCPLTSQTHAQSLSLVGRHIEACGICTPAPFMSRMTIGRLLRLTQPPQPLDHKIPDLFDVPELTNTRFCQPKATSCMGRRMMRGQVLAVLNDTAIVKSRENLIARINFSCTERPCCGDIIEASGLPETDTYVPILRRAVWRKSREKQNDADQTPVDISFASIFLDQTGRHRIDAKYHGQTIRIVSKVRSMPSEIGPANYMLIGDNDMSLPVDITSARPRPPHLDCGCTVEIVGVYLLECQPWRPNAPIPPIDGVRLIVRSANDIRILDTPSWWTAGRLLVVVGILFMGLVLILIWNIALQRLAERRGRTLSDERIARAEAEIKTMERTRLAVELHDTIAQNLTGVSIALDTARQFCQTARPELMRQIDVADATLDSCQTELRNCLWDLRNQALEESDLNTAIRTALLPHVNDAALDIRFNVDRNRLTENTAHAILRIIRELVVNAVRHGQATHIQIAGTLDSDALRFSVRDNGCGFDADNYPGITQKHFGLQGIRERLSFLGGELTIKSTYGSGTRVAATIPLPKSQDQQQST